MPAQQSAMNKGGISAWTWKNPGGQTPPVTYDVLLAEYKGRKHSALAYAQAKARCNDLPLSAMALGVDVVANMMLLPPAAPDMFRDPGRVWEETDKGVWEPTQHLLAGPTFWFSGSGPHHLSVRNVAAFAQERLADELGVAVHLIAHESARIARKADFHVHLLCTARTVTSAGFGAFARELLNKSAQAWCKATWDDWCAQQSMPRPKSCLTPSAFRRAR